MLSDDGCLRSYREDQVRRSTRGSRSVFVSSFVSCSERIAHEQVDPRHNIELELRVLGIKAWRGVRRTRLGEIAGASDPSACVGTFVRCEPIPASDPAGALERR